MTTFRLEPGADTADGRAYRVLVDDVDVSAAVASVELGVYSHPRGAVAVTLTLGAGTVAHAGVPDADVRVDADTAALLGRLGWTAPKEPRR